MTYFEINNQYEEMQAINQRFSRDNIKEGQIRYCINQLEQNIEDLINKEINLD